MVTDDGETEIDLERVIIRGETETRRIWINGREITPARSQAVFNHSPDGFNWGYGGSGPAQLALAILLEFNDNQTAIAHYQQFKWEYVAIWPTGKDFEICMALETVKI